MTQTSRSNARRPLKTGSQCSRLLAHLARGRTITSMEAFRPGMRLLYLRTDALTVGRDVVDEAKEDAK